MSQYNDLDPLRDEIRLLVLFPLSSGAQLRCELRTVSLTADKPVYEALSYCWGDPRVTVPIILEGLDYQVTTNLRDALSRLRLEDDIRLLWVDALCINQADQIEREHQVKLMLQIFSSARRVLGWLGEPSEDSDAGIDLLQEVNETARQTASEDHSHEDSGFAKFLSDLNKPCRALKNLLNRPYWKRAWVLQELAIRGLSEGSELVTLGCGPRWFPVDKALFILNPADPRSIAALIYHEDFGRSTPHTNAKFGHIPGHLTAGWEMLIKIMTVADNRRQFNKRLPLLLRMSRNLQVTNPLDRIYALLGLLERVQPGGQDEPRLEVDYSLTVAELRMRTVEFCVAREKGLSILAGPRPLHGQSPPSWFPICDDGFSQRESPAWTMWQITWQAAGTTAPNIRFLDERHLSVQGQAVDVVAKAYGPFHNFVSYNPNPKGGTIRAFKKETQRIMEELSPAQREDVWRVLILDRLSEGIGGATARSPAPDLAKQMFDIWIKSGDADDQTELTAQDIRDRRFIVPYSLTAYHTLESRCFIVTAAGRLGIGPCGAEPGDTVAMFYGGQSFYLLRESQECHELVGDAYIYGCMDGELVSTAPDAERSFVLC